MGALSRLLPHVELLPFFHFLPFQFSPPMTGCFEMRAILSPFADLLQFNVPRFFVTYHWFDWLLRSPCLPHFWRILPPRLPVPCVFFFFRILLVGPRVFLGFEVNHPLWTVGFPQGPFPDEPVSFFFTSRAVALLVFTLQQCL